MGKYKLDVHKIGRIDYIEPNDLETSFNGIPHPYEDYRMSVDLEVKIPNRMRCNSQGTSYVNDTVYSTENGTLRMMSGTNGFLTTNYTDAVNYNGEDKNTTECVGIESIDIKYDRNFVPQIHIRFVDARGLSFFSPEELAYYKEQERIEKGGTRNARQFELPSSSSFVTSIFMIPSPIFILSVKGYYGRVVKLRLERSMVKVSFDNATGNFAIDADFIGSMFGAYADVPMAFLVLAPFLTYKGAEHWAEKNGSDELFKYEGTGRKLFNFIEYKKLMSTFNVDFTKDGGDISTSDKVKKIKDQVEDLTAIHKFICDFFKERTNEFYGEKTLISDTEKIDLYIPINKPEMILKEEDFNDTEGFNEIVLRKSSLEKWKTFINDYKRYVSGYIKSNQYSSIANSLGEDFFERDGYNSKKQVGVYVNYRYKKSDANNEYIPIDCSYKESGENKERELFWGEENLPGWGENPLSKKSSISILSGSVLNTKISELFKDKNTTRSGFFSGILCFPNVFKALGILEKEIDKKNKELLELNEEINNGNLNSDQSTVLGFKPNVRNYMRMVFAHMDTFVYSFYKILDEIDFNKRRLSDLGINSKTKCDLAPRLLNDPNNFVPVFPLFYNEVPEGIGASMVIRNEIVRPGEAYSGNRVFNADNFEELKLVDSIYNALRKYSSEFTELLGGDSSDSNNGGTYTNFVKTTPGDFIFNQNRINPYKQFSLYEGGDEMYKDIFMTFTARLLVPLMTWPSGFKSDVDTIGAIYQEHIRSFAVIEAFNFLLGNPFLDERIKKMFEDLTMENIVGKYTNWTVKGDKEKIFNSGNYSWFSENGYSYVPIYLDSIKDPYNSESTGRSLYENKDKTWLCCDAKGKSAFSGGTSMEGYPSNNTVYIFSDRRVENEYNNIVTGNYFSIDISKNFGDKIRNAFTQYVPYQVYNSECNNRFIKYAESTETDEKYIGVYTNIHDGDIYGQMGKMWIGADSEEQKEGSYTNNPVWLNSSYRESEVSSDKIDMKVFNFNTRINVYYDGSYSKKLDDFDITRYGTICYGSDFYNAQGKEDEDSILRRAYLFVWSVPFTGDRTSFSSAYERTEIELLREGAFWWRYDIDKSDAEWEEKIIFPETGTKDNVNFRYVLKDLSKIGKLSRSHTFLPVDEYFYAGWRDMALDKRNERKKIKNFGVATLFSAPKNCRIDPNREYYSKIKNIESYSYERRKKLRDYFVNWASGSDSLEFKDIMTAFEDDAKALENGDVEASTYVLKFGCDSGELTATTDFNMTEILKKNTTVGRILIKLAYKVYTFIDLLAPQSLRFLPTSKERGREANSDYKRYNINAQDFINGSDGDDKETSAKSSAIDFAVKEFLGALTTMYSKQTEVDQKYADASNDLNKTDNSKSKDLKLSIYLSLKNIYERHFCGEDPDRWKLDAANQKSDFNNFIFADSYYNDVGSVLCLNSNYVADALDKVITFSSDPAKKEKDTSETGKIKTTTRSVLQFMSDIIENAGMSLNAFPIGNALLTEEGMSEMFSPSQDLYGKATADNYFLCLYPDKPSENLNLGEYSNHYDYSDDSFTIVDMAGTTYNSSATLPAAFNSNSGGRRVPAFGVSYGKQNQSYFTNMTINMDSFTNTEFSIEAEQDIAVRGGQGPRENNLFGQSVYSVYSNYGYTISIEAMGNMQIMPGMMFQLNNIPMFKGTYMIYEVSHNITKQNMTTTFKGGRMKRFSVPLTNTSILEFVTSTDETVIGSSGQSTPESFERYKEYMNGEGKEKMGKEGGIRISMKQLLYSSTANTKKISNMPNQEQLNNLKSLTNNYLIPLFEAWKEKCIAEKFSDTTVSINSGFRTAELQNKINPRTKKSAHMLGWAADLWPRCGKFETFTQFCQDFLKEKNLKYDQLIIESNKSGSRWIHLGVYNNEHEQRMQTFKMVDHQTVK